MARKNSITDEMVAQIKAMHERGDKGQDIAAWFGINQGRVSDVCGVKPKPEYSTIDPDKIGIPPPGPYDFGGGGIERVYRVITEVKALWDEGKVQHARVKFDSLYRSLGRQSEADAVADIVANLFYDERGVPKL